MGGDDRRLAQFDDLPEGLVGKVRHVDHRAQPVHFRDQPLAERRQALPAFERIVGGVGDVVAFAVG